MPIFGQGVGQVADKRFDAPGRWGIIFGDLEDAHDALAPDQTTHLKDGQHDGHDHETDYAAEQQNHHRLH